MVVSSLLLVFFVVLGSMMHVGIYGNFQIIINI